MDALAERRFQAGEDELGLSDRLGWCRVSLSEVWADVEVDLLIPTCLKKNSKEL